MDDNSLTNALNNLKRIILEERINPTAGLPLDLFEFSTTLLPFVNVDLFIQPFTKIGDNNVFWSNVNICHHTEIGNFNFFAASCAVLGKIVIKDRCFIGCNATVKNRTIIESDTLIGAAAYLDRNTETESVIVPSRSIKLEKKSSEMHL